MSAAQIGPNERFALIGKTRSGKTALAMVLAATFARSLGNPWEVWWIDTKNDPKDLKQLRAWGFRNVASDEDRQTSLLTNALYYIVNSDAKDSDDTKQSVVAKCQAIFRAAYERKHVIVVVDEYVQCVPSSRNAGDALLDIFQRGGGRNVGLIGLTQEPVYVPRQLLSQATHQVIFSLTHAYDIKYVKAMEPQYESPIKMGDPYGFWWKWVDGNGEVTYFPNQRVWFDTLRVAMPRS
jgi:hypothetical protein